MTATITLHIEGLHCDACERLIKDVLIDEKGVTAVTVTRDGPRATAKIVGTAQPAQLARAVEHEGYTVHQ